MNVWVFGGGGKCTSCSDGRKKRSLGAGLQRRIRKKIVEIRKIRKGNPLAREEFWELRVKPHKRGR